MKKVQKYDLYITVSINGDEYHSTNIIYNVEEYKQVDNYHLEIDGKYTIYFADEINKIFPEKIK